MIHLSVQEEEEADGGSEEDLLLSGNSSFAGDSRESPRNWPISGILGIQLRSARQSDTLFVFFLFACSLNNNRKSQFNFTASSSDILPCWSCSWKLLLS